MNITFATFVKGVVGPDEVLESHFPQIAFVGRSNVGKSSLINSLTNQKNLARTSSLPGRTQELNVFLINKSYYLVDLPGYGFAKGSKEAQERIQQLIYWYLFDSGYEQKKAVLIVDANIGLTENDFDMLRSLKEAGKNVVVVANKVDKIKKSEYDKKIREIKDAVGQYKIFFLSSEKKIGIGELSNELFSK